MAPLFIKKIYRFVKWVAITLLSQGKNKQVVYIDPADINFGQTPKSQFPAKSTYRFTRDGDWDRDLIPIENHLLYQSYVDHFIHSRTWEDTPFFKMAAAEIKDASLFRGEYADIPSLKMRFEQCEKLYYEIAKNGYQSNSDLYRKGEITNILFLLDEVTVNVTRDGEVVLNDGWHRFVTARILGLKSIPVRVLVCHSKMAKYASI